MGMIVVVIFGIKFSCNVVWCKVIFEEILVIGKVEIYLCGFW